MPQLNLNDTLWEIALLFILFLIGAVKNGTGLYYSLCLYIKGLKVNAIITGCGGRTKKAYYSTKRALAKYSLNDKEQTGKMLCPYDDVLKPGEKREIIINKKCPSVFALTQEHIKGYLIKKGILTGLFMLLLILHIVFTVNFIPDDTLPMWN